LSIRNPVHENGSRGEYLLERVENITTGGIKLSVNVLPGKACQWNNNIQVVEDKPVIKVSKT